MAKGRYIRRGRSLGTADFTSVTAGQGLSATGTIAPANFSFCCYARMTSTNAAWALVSLDNGTQFVGVYTSGTGNTWGAQSDANGASTPLFGAVNSSPTLNVWHFVYITGGSSWTAGGREGPYGTWAVKTGTNTTLTAGNAYIGVDGVGDNGFPGQIAGVRFWGRNLSQQELMNEARQLAPVRSDGLINYFPLYANSITGSRIFDESGAPGALAWNMGLIVASQVPAPVPEVLAPQQYWFFVPAATVPTQFPASFPDRGDVFRPKHQLHLEPAVFQRPILDRKSPLSEQSFPERLVRANTGPDWWTTVGQKEQKQSHGTEQWYPDRVDRAPPRSDYVTTVGRPERKQVYNDQDFPDRLVRAKTGPDWWTTQQQPILVTVPTQAPTYYQDELLAPERIPQDQITLVTIGQGDTGAQWQYPDALRLPGRAPDWWTTIGRPERTQVYNDQDFPDRVLRARTAPDWSPTTGRPDRTQVYADQDFPDRVVRRTTAPDDRTLWPLPLPNLAAPVEGYWSYPDRLVRPTTAPDAWEQPPRPERTAPIAVQFYPDRVLRATAAPDWVETTGRPEERLPSPWLSYPDRVLRATTAPDWSQEGQAPPRPPPAWTNYPDVVQGRPFPTIEQMVSTLWPRPIATPATPEEYPDVIYLRLQPQYWDQAWSPRTTIPVLPNNVVWLGPKTVIVPILAGDAIQPSMEGVVLVPILGKPVI
jgi:hypothetical protein